MCNLSSGDPLPAPVAHDEAIAHAVELLTDFEKVVICTVYESKRERQGVLNATWDQRHVAEITFEGVGAGSTRDTENNEQIHLGARAILFMEVKAPLGKWRIANDYALRSVAVPPELARLPEALTYISSKLEGDPVLLKFYVIGVPKGLSEEDG